MSPAATEAIAETPAAVGVTGATTKRAATLGATGAMTDCPALAGVTGAMMGRCSGRRRGHCILISLG